MKTQETDILLDKIVDGIKQMKGKDVNILDLQKLKLAVCKYFVICTGSSNTHVLSISDNIKKNVLKEIKEKPWHVEGKETSQWILMDYSDIVVHVFQKETRKFYNIEDLWGDASLKKNEIYN